MSFERLIRGTLNRGLKVVLQAAIKFIWINRVIINKQNTENSIKIRWKVRKLRHFKVLHYFGKTVLCIFSWIFNEQADDVMSPLILFPRT